MTDAMDLSTPVTRGELRAELDERIAPLVTRAEFEARIAPLATRVELEIWGGALLARIEAVERRLDGLEERVLAELARHARAICEAVSAQIAASHEHYADLPPRVSRLEAKVFAPRRR